MLYVLLYVHYIPDEYMVVIILLVFLSDLYMDNKSIWFQWIEQKVIFTVSSKKVKQSNTAIYKQSKWNRNKWVTYWRQFPFQNNAKHHTDRKDLAKLMLTLSVKVTEVSQNVAPIDNTSKYLTTSFWSSSWSFTARKST